MPYGTVPSYANLKQAIQDYTQNSETTFVSNIPNFVTATEELIYFSTDLPSAWTSVDSVTENAATSVDASKKLGIYNVGTSTVAGTDVIEVFSVRLSQTTGSEGAGNADKGPLSYLLRKDYDFLLEAYPGSVSASSTGFPKYYAISSAGEGYGLPTYQIRLGPAPDNAYPMTIDYSSRAAVDSIVNDTDGTWVSSAFPDLLLQGALHEAYKFMKGEPDLIEFYGKGFQTELLLFKSFVEGRDPKDRYRSGRKRSEEI